MPKDNKNNNYIKHTSKDNNNNNNYKNNNNSDNNNYNSKSKKNINYQKIRIFQKILFKNNFFYF